MEHRYRKGDKFTLSETAIENYGERFRDRPFTVAEWFDHAGTDDHGHPGFDDSGGLYLYDIEELPFSLYAWEMQPI